MKITLKNTRSPEEEHRPRITLKNTRSPEERQRRLDEIQAERHPNSGEPLQFTGVRTLRGEEWAAADRLLREHDRNYAKTGAQIEADPAVQRHLKELGRRATLPAHIVRQFVDEDLARQKLNRILAPYAELIRVREYFRDQLLELETRYKLDGNPLFAWEAYDIAITYGFEIPEWVFISYLHSCARNILAIRDEAVAGHLPTREAERVGKALGFDTGTGRGSRFAAALGLQTDRAIYLEVNRWRARHGGKMASAISAIATARGVSVSTIERRHREFRKLIGRRAGGR